MQCFMGRQRVCQFPFITYHHSSNEGNGLVGWKLVIYVDLINSIHAWSKNGHRTEMQTEAPWEDGV